MAQSVEQLICNLQVMGSSPFTSSRKKQKALTEISVRAFLFGVPRGALYGFFLMRKNIFNIPQNNL